LLLLLLLLLLLAPQLQLSRQSQVTSSCCRGNGGLSKAVNQMDIRSTLRHQQLSTLALAMTCGGACHETSTATSDTIKQRPQHCHDQHSDIRHHQAAAPALP
jgi:hypothetical protein